MNISRSLRLPLAASAALVAGLTLGTFGPDWGVGAPTPAVSPAAEQEVTAWEVFDYAGGPAKLKVDTSREFRVVFLGTSDAYPKALADDVLVLPAKDGQWYLFRAATTN